MGIYDEIEGLLPASGAGVVAALAHGLIEVRGPDAADFLHRLCSQDVLGLAEGRCRLATFLTGKGKLIATAAIGRLADRFLVEAQASVLAGLAELLDRYHFTEKLEIARREDLVAAALCGPGAARAAGLEPGSCTPGPGGSVVLCGVRRGIARVRCHGPAEAVDAWRSGLAEPVLEPDLAECLRILGGDVRIGTDTDASTLVLEAALDDHLSLQKGCYTGQEIVARIHTYGHVNRELALLRLETEERIEPGTALCETSAGDPVGRATSAATVPGRDFSVGLGYLPEAFLAAGGTLALGSAAGPRVTVLPFADP